MNLKQEIRLPEHPKSIYLLSIETAQGLNKLPKNINKEVSEKLIDDNLYIFFNIKVRSWCKQSISQKRIDLILKKFKELEKTKFDDLKYSQIQLELTKEITLLWQAEKVLLKEIKKRKLEQMFLLGGIVVGLTFITTVKKGVDNASNINFPFYELQIENLPNSLQGTAIVHLTDLHADNSLIANPINSKTLIKIKENLKNNLIKQNIDLSKLFITITGDIFSEGASDKEIREIASILGSFPGKKFFVLGNHDVRHKNTDLIISSLKDNNIPHLKSNLEVDNIKFTGLPDATTQSDLYTPQLISNIKNPAKRFKIILNHDLTSIDSLLSNMKNTLVLSGHTHGGQINIVPKPWQNWFYNLINFNYHAQIFSGVKQINKNTLVSVSNGVGVHSLPIRFNAPPEIPIFILNNLKKPSSINNTTNNVVKNIRKVFKLRK